MSRARSAPGAAAGARGRTPVADAAGEPVPPASEVAPVRRLAPALLLASAAGLALPFAFAPTELWPLAPIALLGLYTALQGRTAREALAAGWLFGLGYFGLGVHWVYHSLHLFGAAIAPLAALLSALFVLVMTLFPALTAWLWARLHAGGALAPARPVAAALLFAALWTLAELLRGKLMGGFPWILVGYSQTTGPLGPLAPLVGVYGIGFVLVTLSVLALPLGHALLGRFASAGRVGAGRTGARGADGGVADAAVVAPRRSTIAALIGVVGIVVAAALAPFYRPSAPLGEPLAVRLVQANIPQEMKFSRERLDNALRLYTGMTLAGGLDGIDLVVWPETAIPTYFSRVDDALAPFVASLDAAGVDVLAGGFHREGERVWNSVRQLGGARALYRKRHLVPFGEYMPLRPLLEWFARYVDIPMSDLSEGEGPHVPLAVQGERIGVSICYEDVYGEEMRALLPESTLLVNVSNDAWFGPSAAPHQHEQKARMRAREMGRPLVRVTNTGVSSAIEHDGRVLGRIGHDEKGTLDVLVQPREGTTLYALTGNWPVFLLASCVAAWGAFVARRGVRRARAAGA